ncbi:MAG: fructosamine kinase family protein [Proteobacteria bacterium]|nr:fructosamine kinase family protein [Pseudomonadota bacterium]
MADNRQIVESILSDYFNEKIEIRAQASVSGGCINQAWKLTLSNGQDVFKKENSARFKGMFEAEAEGLKALKVEDGPHVPEPIATHADGNSQFILMTFIRQSRREPKFWEEFGRAFARLHTHHKADYYGFLGDNYIGSTPQTNPKCSSWVEFFGEHRLGFQIRLAAEQGLANSQLIGKTERLICRLSDYLPEPEHPSILHGDLWGGNVMTGEFGQAVIIDPAVYYGHNEADLAMTELFGGFDSTFYAAYNEVLGISHEYEESRRDIYGLYHVLNHLNLFGGSYASQALSMVRCFV